MSLSNKYIKSDIEYYSKTRNPKNWFIQKSDKSDIFWNPTICLS